MIDLHLHTTASDGLWSPVELVTRAAAAGITVLSATDHDTVAALPDVSREASAAGLGFVPGIELTAVRDGVDVHILGYFFDPQAPGLEAFLRLQRESRRSRAREIADRLAALDAPIDVEALMHANPPQGGTSVSRPLIAHALIAAGHVASVREAFDRFLGNGRPAYVPHKTASPLDVISSIRAAGGIASLAHPGLLRRDEMIPQLRDAGLEAIEAHHSDHDAATRTRYTQLADSLGLAVTGGSDYHGERTRRASSFGRVGLTPDEYARLCELRT